MTINSLSKSEAAIEARARRAARRIGMRAIKSRWRKDSIDNYGGFMVIGDNNIPQAGWRYDMSAEEVIDYCQA